MTTNEIKVGQTVRYSVTRSNVVVAAIRKATKDSFGDILTPATVTFKTQDGTFWDNVENFEVAR